MNIFLGYLAFVFVFMFFGFILLESLMYLFQRTFKSLAEFFNPPQLLPADVVAELEDEAFDLIWSMHRVGDEPNLGNYHCIFDYLYKLKFQEHLGPENE